jgi:Na+-transporting methylmalonyl-CoA/oxaloacetate decarboxylase gamma subunit
MTEPATPRAPAPQPVQPPPATDAIGGAIGTGLFMGSGKTISLAGPSIVFVYLIIGAMLFFVMRAMGELLLSNCSTNPSSISPPTCSARGPGSSVDGPTGSAGSSPPSPM